MLVQNFFFNKKDSIATTPEFLYFILNVFLWEFCNSQTEYAAGSSFIGERRGEMKGTKLSSASQCGDTDVYLSVDDGQIQIAWHINDDTKWQLLLHD